MDKMCNIVRSNITYLDSFTRSMVLCYYIALSQKMDGFDRTDNLTDLLYHVGPVVYEPYLTWLLVPYEAYRLCSFDTLRSKQISLIMT